jgi:hypothetical protein
MPSSLGFHKSHDDLFRHQPAACISIPTSLHFAVRNQSTSSTSDQRNASKFRSEFIILQANLAVLLLRLQNAQHPEAKTNYSIIQVPRRVQRSRKCNSTDVSLKRTLFLTMIHRRPFALSTLLS